jgi:hypothetical protein
MRPISRRFSLIAGTMVVAVAIIVAFVIHGPARIYCSRLAGAPPLKCPQPPDHLVIIRVAIIAGGLIIALAIHAVTRTLANRRQQ